MDSPSFIKENNDMKLHIVIVRRKQRQDDDRYDYECG